MSLERYHRKRDFQKTPEPEGRESRGPVADVARRDAQPFAAPSGPRRYVVQRHRASRLHYDFRLEIEGVLMSWAVPRGPSLNPADKRMAVRTEDHPLEYFDFEGTIPRGEYGGGDVIVWDWGTFEPEETGDPGDAVRRGELKFRLHGEKLRGRFTLVRSGRGNAQAGIGDAEKEEWLLIHKRGEAADPDWDIDQLPRSVKTGRTNEQVAAGADAVWDSRAPAAEAEIDLSAATPAPLPEFVPPMRATAISEPFSSPDWLFELKLDGYRVEAVVDDGRVQLWTRNRQDAGKYFPDLTGTPGWIRAQSAVVDGEVVALNAAGVPDFSLLQDRTGLRGFGADGASGATRVSEKPSPAPVVYYAFDLLHLDGRSLLEVPLEERKKLLRSVLRSDPSVRYGSHVETDGREFHAAAAERGLEGIVAKHRRSRYEPGARSRQWLKLKIRREQEFVVGGYEPGKGTHSDLGSLAVGVYEGDQLRFAGHVGSGLDARARRELRARLDELRRDEPPFVDAPRIKNARWAEPEVVIRAEFAEWTADGLLRQAAFKGLEIGREPRTVAREREIRTATARRDTTAATRGRAPTPSPDAPPAVTPNEPAQAATADELAQLEALGKEGTWQLGGHQVALSNLDKVLFPDAGFTKRDLIRYYVSIAPVMLPYLRDRALNLWRWPNGITGAHFWQKEIPKHAPEWVARWEFPEAESSEAHTYIVADRVATMAWLANHATIDVHPWTSRAADYTRPTCALIDIDPGDRTTWDEVVLLARLYHSALEHLGVSGFPKVTGKRGIQVWVPVEPIYSFEETRAWVEAISRAIGQTVPELVSWEWEKVSRKGLARLDYTQNAINKTLVAPYAVRPAAGAPVSAPIRWEELDDTALRPDRWSIRSVLDRVNERGDLFAGVLATTQRLPTL